MTREAPQVLNVTSTTIDTDLLAALVEFTAVPHSTTAEDLLADVEALAARHGVDPDILINALDQPDLLRQVQAQVQTSRQRGDLLRRQSLPVIETLVETAHRMATEDMVSPAVLPRLLDVIFKLTGIAEERGARLRAELAPQPPTLHLNILSGDMPAPVAAKPGELSLTIISPDWTGGPKRVVAEQGVSEQ
jgi:nucleotide-binding universal stress UspA family protein